MGNRFTNQRIKYNKFTSIWPGKKQGRYWKRQLSKARRRQADYLIDGDYRRANSRGLWAEQMCNWKTW